MIKYKTIIGRAEAIDFPKEMLLNIPAKVDTGAYLSAVHATDIEIIEKSNGSKVLQFTLLGDHPSTPFSKKIQTKNYEIKTIVNSFAHKQERYVVNFRVKLAGKVFTTKFSLADRSKKAFPILIGRALTNKRFLVDTDIAHIDRKHLKMKLKDWLARDDMNDNEETS